MTLLPLIKLYNCVSIEPNRFMIWIGNNQVISQLSQLVLLEILYYEIMQEGIVFQVQHDEWKKIQDVRFKNRWINQWKVNGSIFFKLIKCFSHSRNI